MLDLYVLTKLVFKVLHDHVVTIKAFYLLKGVSFGVTCVSLSKQHLSEFEFREHSYLFFSFIFFYLLIKPCQFNKTILSFCLVFSTDLSVYTPEDSVSLARLKKRGSRKKDLPVI